MDFEKNQSSIPGKNIKPQFSDYLVESVKVPFRNEF